MKNIILQLRNIKKHYGSGANLVKALDGIDLVVNEGDFLIIQGASGSGKSTLLNIIGCLDRPTSGDVIIKDINLKDLNDDSLTDLRNKNIGFIFQRFNLMNILNVKENILFPLDIGGLTIDEEYFSRIVRILGIESILDKMPNELSGGQQQRVAIARALITKPALLLADEPTGNLDSKNSAGVVELIKEANMELNQTILLITHDDDIVRKLSESGIVKLKYIKDGRLGEF